MTKVLGIMGSPRKGKNTDRLLDAVLAGAAGSEADTHKVYVTDLAIKPCFSCYACARLGHCVIKDDMQGVYLALGEADVIILASPLYFFGISAQAKALIDRCQTAWSRQHHLQRPALSPKMRLGAFLCTGGAPNRQGGNFQPALATAKIWFRALQVQYAGELIAADTDRTATWDRASLLQEARELGGRLVQEASR